MNFQKIYKAQDLLYWSCMRSSEIHSPRDFIPNVTEIYENVMCLPFLLPWPHDSLLPIIFIGKPHIFCNDTHGTDDRSLFGISIQSSSSDAYAEGTGGVHESKEACSLNAPATLQFPDRTRWEKVNYVKWDARIAGIGLGWPVGVVVAQSYYNRVSIVIGCSPPKSITRWASRFSPFFQERCSWERQEYII